MQILVIQHHRENRRKCSLTPLRDRPDLEVHVPRAGSAGYSTLEIQGGILLRVEAPILSLADRAILEEDPGRRLVLIDANWIKVPAMLRYLRSRGPLEARSLPSWIRTAYPRRSKVSQDPPGGLASVEAIAAARAILGCPDPTLLSGYPWAERFQELNPQLFGDRLAPVQLAMANRLGDEAVRGPRQTQVPEPIGGSLSPLKE